MKRLQFLLLFGLSLLPARAQWGAKDAPDYDGYRTFDSFGQDTVRYLQYNWGRKTGGVHENTTLIEFFDKFELAIREVEIRCTTPGGISEVTYIRFWLYPKEQAVIQWQQEGSYSSRYSLVVHSLLPTIDRHSMLYDDLKPHIPELKPDGRIILPWKESYREALGPFVVGAIQYNYWRE